MHVSPDAWHLRGVGLVDLVVALVVVVAVLGALRRRQGLLSSLASGALALVAAWLVCWGLSVFAPPAIAHDVATSRLAGAVPFPHHAGAELGDLTGHPAPAHP